MFNWKLVTAVISALATTAIGVVAAYKSGYSKGSGNRELNTVLGLTMKKNDANEDPDNEDTDDEEIQI